jgi:Tol biopolymer transport system component
LLITSAAFGLAEERLIFTSNRSGIGQIYSIRPDATDIQQLTFSTDVGQKGSARISPDGTEITFVGNTNQPYGVGELYIVNCLSGEEETITNTGGKIKLNTGLAWSSDGQWILAVYGNPGSADNYLVRIERNTGNIFTVCSMGGSAGVGDIEWNGTRRIHNGGSSCYSTVYDGDLFDTDCRYLFNTPLADNNPRFSPDGSKIAWTKQRDGTCGHPCAYEIAIIDSDGDPFSITVVVPGNDNYCALGPIWSPDGWNLAFADLDLSTSISSHKIIDLRTLNITNFDIGGQGAITDWRFICAGPSPDLKANGSDGPLYLTPEETLSITVSLEPACLESENADWWVLAHTPFGWYYYNLDNRWWYPGVSVTYQGPLFPLPTYEVLNISGLPAGLYRFYFGVDMIMNGTIDFGKELYYDTGEVHIAPRGKT